jgi:hypothetical protein
LFSALLAAASGVSAIQSAPAPVPSCVTDEPLALLKGNEKGAFPLCREYFDISASHIVDVSTVTPVASTYLSTETITITDIESTITLDVSTTVVTSFETTIVSTFTYTEPAQTPPAKLKRRNVASLSSALGTYAPASVSSACSCLNVSRCHKRSESTTTLDASTFTSIATSTDVVSSTTTITQFYTATSVTATTESIVTSTTITALPEPTLFHLVTTLAGEDQYYKSTPWGGGIVWDLVYPSPGTVGAVPFQFNDLGQLTMPSISQGSTVFAAQGTEWFASPYDSFWFIFRTPAAHQQDGWVSYQYEVDTADDNNLKVSTHDGSQPLKWQLCDRGDGRPMLATAHLDATSSNCEDTMVRAEYFFLSAVSMGGKVIMLMCIHHANKICNLPTWTPLDWGPKLPVRG